MTPRTRSRLLAAIAAALKEADARTVRATCIEALGQRQPGRPGGAIPEDLARRAAQHVDAGGTLTGFAAEASVAESTLRAAVKRYREQH